MNTKKRLTGWLKQQTTPSETQEDTERYLGEAQSLFQSTLYAMSLQDIFNYYERFKKEETKTAALLTAEVLINKLVIEVKEMSQIEMGQRAKERQEL